MNQYVQAFSIEAEIEKEKKMRSICSKKNVDEQTFKKSKLNWRCTAKMTEFQSLHFSYLHAKVIEH